MKKEAPEIREQLRCKCNILLLYIAIESDIETGCSDINEEGSINNPVPITVRLYSNWIS